MTDFIRDFIRIEYLVRWRMIRGDGSFGPVSQKYFLNARDAFNFISPLTHRDPPLAHVELQTREVGGWSSFTLRELEEAAGGGR